MNDNEQTPAGQFPCQRVMGIASIACFASLILIYWLAKPAVELLAIPWLKFLLYAIIPIAITFIILHRSDWHREMTGAARMCALFLLSCVILAGVLVVIALSFGFVLVFVNVFNGGFRANHA